jgi:arylsulfatase A-like enzyme
MMAALTGWLWFCSASRADTAKPNIVFILADDLGYGELGCFGQQKIRTPNLDQLAARGMRFTQHYSGNAVCAPSRCVLMTGKHPGHAFIRNNRSTPPEGQYPIPADTQTLPKLLGQHGYVCGGFGKWGLGGPGSAGEPLKQGLHRFFGFNCQGVAHNHYPTHLWDNDQQVRLNNHEFSAHQALAKNLDPSDPASYSQFKGNEFAQDRIIEQALSFVRDNRDRPFFLYVPSTIPHVAIQVPDDSLREYLGQFEETPYIGNKGYLPHFTPRAAFAAMITRLDRDVGRIVAQIRELGLEENTLFVFSSDNGPLDHAYQGFAGTDGRFFNSAGPLRGQKGSLYEGGFRVPTIACWKGKIPAGRVSDRVSGFEDWLPTLLEVAGAKELIPAGTDGISFLPTLRGQPQPERPFLYREFPDYGGQQCVRVGDWKAVRQNLNPRGKAAETNPAKIVVKTELYNLKEDIAESKDVATQHPELIAKLERILREQHTASAEFPFPVLDRAN